MNRVFAILSCAVVLGACSNIDYSHFPEYAQQYGQCFTLQTETYLIDHYCDTSTNGKLESVDCYSIHAFESDVAKAKKYKKPLSWDDYINDREKWDTVIFGKDTDIFAKVILAGLTLKAPIKAGTKIKIVAIYGEPKGSTGHVMRVTARILEGEQAGTHVAIPVSWTSWDRGPDWIPIMFQRKGESLPINQDYLRQCSDLAG